MPTDLATRAERLARLCDVPFGRPQRCGAAPRDEDTGVGMEGPHALSRRWFGRLVQGTQYPVRPRWSLLVVR